MSKYERRLFLAMLWEDAKLWLLMAAIVGLPTALMIWVLLEYR
jgi:hypothetical protein